MLHLITSIDDVTPAWLTNVLHRHACSPHTVQHIHVTRIHDEQLHSISYQFTVLWSPDAPDTLPTRFFLKLPRHPDTDANTHPPGAHEVAMYQFLAAHQHALPVIRCYDAVYDTRQRRYHLLLADLSHSHHQPTWHLAIDEVYVRQTITCLAQVHAYWWERPDECHPFAVLPTANRVAQDIEQIQAALPRFFAAVGAQFTPEDRQIYAQLVTVAPRLWARRLAPSHPTLVHGDAHYWNFLYPQNDTIQTTYILDWQQQHIDWGVSDLAYLLVLRYPHRTRANEYQLVQHYHATLTQHGVTEYAWSACWHDYRRAAVVRRVSTLRYAS